MRAVGILLSPTGRASPQDQAHLREEKHGQAWARSGTGSGKVSKFYYVILPALHLVYFQTSYNSVLPVPAANACPLLDACYTLISADCKWSREVAWSPVHLAPELWTLFVFSHRGRGRQRSSSAASRQTSWDVSLSLDGQLQPCHSPPDVMMPQVGGLDLLRYVRSHKHLSDLPVVSEFAQLRCHQSMQQQNLYPVLSASLSCQQGPRPAAVAAGRDEACRPMR
ncbi:hypothetical protein HaLaN_27472 [Haematococcus lacustris]|uniref:PH domain-containing protein n=1 Tax=Haematococcus lacustris TaxID=44745 RepID=A0A6A0A8H2_HAELA|nr:hypothetical protein HaLaN_27472 [Haematococcus lacustris]